MWWLRAEDPATLRSDFAELAQALGLPSEQDDQAVASLRQELRRRPDWLLIFDNAEEPDDLFRLLPDRHRGHVLVTTRRREWPHAETSRLGGLPPQAAVAYLQQRGQVADAGTATELADALGRLPLALAQAASVIADGMPASDYLGLLREQSPELFAEGRTGDHHLTVDSTWRVSVDRLARRSPAAVALFRLAAFLNADAIPLAQLSASTELPAELADALNSPFQLTKATRALNEYSLAETGDGLLSIHRMVQAVTRTELGQDEPHWAGLALMVIDAAFPQDVIDPKTWDACEAVLTHALAASDHATRLATDAMVNVRLLNRVARYLLTRGRIDLAGSAITQALALFEQQSHDDLLYLTCRSTYGRVALTRGDVAVGRTIQEEVYGARTRILGAEDPDTLRAGRDLVEALFRQGHPKDAARLHDQLVDAFISALGPDDLETVTTLAYQATLLGDAGQYARARTIEEQVLEIRSRVLGAEHPDTLIAKNNLAATLGNLGQLGQARVLQEQVVEASSRVMGPEHPETLTSKISLAAMLGDLGELGQARVLQEKVVEAMDRVMGSEHPETLRARRNLAAMLSDLGEHSHARVLEEKVVEAMDRVIGSEHPKTLRARRDLAVMLGDLGELGQARVLGEKVVEAMDRVIGSEHPETLQARRNLAQILYLQGNRAQAHSLLAESLGVSLRLHGKRHSISSEIAWELAESCGSHEANRRKMIIMENLSWLVIERSGQLTARQKKIKNALKGPISGKKKSSQKSKKRHR